MYQKHQTLYPLSGKIYCEKHKCSYVRKIKHYKNKPDDIFWYCSDFHKTGKKDCVLPYFKQTDLYNILLSTFKSYNIYKDEICKELLSLYNSVENQKEHIKYNLENELKILKQKNDILLDLTLNGTISKEEFSNKKLAFERKREQIITSMKEFECKNNVRILNNKLKFSNDYNEVLKENIEKELEITEDNLENYIQELLDKVIVKDGKKLNIIVSNNLNTILSLPCTW